MVSATDDVELRAVTIGSAVPGIPEPLVYPQQVVDPRFNDAVNSPVTQSVTMSVPTPTLLGVSDDLAVAPNGPLQAARVIGWDAANRGAGIGPTNFVRQGFPLLTNVSGAASGTNPFSSWSVISTLSPLYSAPSGVKATLRGPPEIAAAPFERVEFYRLVSGDGAQPAPLNGAHWQYLGSVSRSAIPIVDNGPERFWTFTLRNENYAALPHRADEQQEPVAPGDIIMAIGILSNGSGFSAVSTIQ
jgi:hypothetical protein